MHDLSHLAPKLLPLKEGTWDTLLVLCGLNVFFTNVYLSVQLQQQQHLPRQMGQAQRNPYPQVSQYQGKTMH